MKTDIEIAQENKMLPITDVAKSAGIGRDGLEVYGRYKAKLSFGTLTKLKTKPDGRLILVTAITPTPAGEGKTTTAVGLADAMMKLGKKTMLALREPSLGPVFGMKGGAAGGGYAQVVPMEDINLHFTGDLDAIASANNLLAAMTDNSIFQGNPLGLDPRRVAVRRCLDMNDRQLRFITDGLGGAGSGMPREDGFDITAASEVMAAFCLADGVADLRRRLGDIVAGYTFAGEPVTARQLGAQGAMTALLRDAIKPNLVQTLEHTPALVHGGPFANIAHGCNSVMATKAALKLADYVVTEAGFGADLGAEKFIDIKCRMSGLRPSAAVIVATVRALKLHGGASKDELGQENLAALRRGMANLRGHIENITEVFGLPAVVALNQFPSDTQAELELVMSLCREAGADAALSEAWSRGAKGAEELAEKVLKLADAPVPELKFAYDAEMKLYSKLDAVARGVYGADGVDFTPAARRDIDRLEQQGFGALPVCIAKTQYSFSDDPKLLGRPRGFRITVRAAHVSAGAGFVVALTGNIMTMPGLPKKPAAEGIDVLPDGRITGIF